MFQKSWSYAILFLRYGMWQIYLFFILGHFLPFYLPKSPKNQNLKKNEKTPGDIIILHKVPKTMIICYTVPEIWHLTDVIVIFYFGLFITLSAPNSPKNQNRKKWKKYLKISRFYICVPKIMIRWCKVPEIWCTMDGRTAK